ncbi:MAG: prolyl oligopeptidase family serine peptidase [Candidatus Eisenbacteria bacterium]
MPGVWISLLLVLGLVQSLLSQEVPHTRSSDVVEVLHGVSVHDPYRWLEDQESPETRAWIDAQNACTESVLGALPGRNTIRQEITALKRIDAVTTPTGRAGKYFFTKRLADQDQYCIYMKEGYSGEDRLLIDPHPLSPDHTVNIEIDDVTADGRLLAYGIRQGGEDETVVRLFDVATGQNLADRLPRADYFSVCLQGDGSGMYYARYDSTGTRVFHHVMGTDVADDVEIFGKGFGPEKAIEISLSEDDRYLVFHVYLGSAASNDIYVADLAQGGEIAPVVKDIDASFEGHVGGGNLFIKTDWQAPKGRVLAVDLADTRPEAWREVIPEGDDIIEDITLAGGKIFASYIHNAIPSIRIFEADGEPRGSIDLPAIGYVSSVYGRWGAKEAFYSFSSYHIPTRTYLYDIDDGTISVWAVVNAPIPSERFEVEQAWYQSKDGMRVPMFIGHAKSLKLDGSNPVILTGYGGFRSSATPYYSAYDAWWLMHGGVVAEPNLRGGAEFGEEWHRAGMLEKKQNTFDDFIAAAEYLVKEGYTSPAKLAISGGSNGGLLVGAAMTQRPDLFRAVVCSYPLLDMIRYHKFMLAPFWVPEYGSSEDSEQFKYIYAYSPYHHVKEGVAYPATLLISGDADTRVAPLHARKMTARLQAATASAPSERPVLLRYDTKGGHSGGTPVTKQIDDMTDELAFLVWQLGLKL